MRYNFRILCGLATTLLIIAGCASMVREQSIQNSVDRLQSMAQQCGVGDEVIENAQARIQRAEDQLRPSHAWHQIDAEIREIAREEAGLRAEKAQNPENAAAIDVLLDEKYARRRELWIQRESEEDRTNVEAQIRYSGQVLGIERERSCAIVKGNPFLPSGDLASRLSRDMIPTNFLDENLFAGLVADGVSPDQAEIAAYVAEIQYRQQRINAMKQCTRNNEQRVMEIGQLISLAQQIAQSASEVEVAARAYFSYGDGAVQRAQVESDLLSNTQDVHPDLITAVAAAAARPNSHRAAMDAAQVAGANERQAQAASIAVKLTPALVDSLAEVEQFEDSLSEKTQDARLVAEDYLLQAAERSSPPLLNRSQATQIVERVAKEARQIIQNNSPTGRASRESALRIAARRAATEADVHSFIKDDGMFLEETVYQFTFSLNDQGINLYTNEGWPDSEAMTRVTEARNKAKRAAIREGMSESDAEAVAEQTLLAKIDAYERASENAATAALHNLRQAESTRQDMNRQIADAAAERYIDHLASFEINDRTVQIDNAHRVSLLAAIGAGGANSVARRISGALRNLGISDLGPSLRQPCSIQNSAACDQARRVARQATGSEEWSDDQWESWKEGQQASVTALIQSAMTSAVRSEEMADQVSPIADGGISFEEQFGNDYQERMRSIGQEALSRAEQLGERIDTMPDWREPEKWRYFGYPKVPFNKQATLTPWDDSGVDSDYDYGDLSSLNRTSIREFERLVAAEYLRRLIDSDATPPDAEISRERRYGSNIDSYTVTSIDRYGFESFSEYINVLVAHTEESKQIAYLLLAKLQPIQALAQTELNDYAARVSEQETELDKVASQRTIDADAACGLNLPDNVYATGPLPGGLLPPNESGEASFQLARAFPRSGSDFFDSRNPGSAGSSSGLPPPPPPGGGSGPFSGVYVGDLFLIAGENLLNLPFDPPRATIRIRATVNGTSITLEEDSASNLFVLPVTGTGSVNAAGNIYSFSNLQGQVPVGNSSVLLSAMGTIIMSTPASTELNVDYNVADGLATYQFSGFKQ